MKNDKQKTITLTPSITPVKFVLNENGRPELILSFHTENTNLQDEVVSNFISNALKRGVQIIRNEDSVLQDIAQYKIVIKEGNRKQINSESHSEAIENEIPSLIDIGNKIKEHRISKGWSQKYLAKKLGISPGMLVYYEKGKYFPRNPKVKAKLKNILGID
jgi:DNA-binding XRE family transcriptional regulator